MSDNQYEIKSICNELPQPIAFNCWKHHLGYVKNILFSQSVNRNEKYIQEIIQFIGESQFDLYTGALDIIGISNEIMNHLRLIDVINLEEYKGWVNSDGKDYRFITLSDGSNWTLRLGQSNYRFIHIHPSRHSKKSVRVKNSTLKTVYAFLFYYGIAEDEISIEKVNFVRNKFVKLPPFKPSSTLVAISRILDLFIR
jgi:hypothetical protein